MQLRRFIHSSWATAVYLPKNEEEEEEEKEKEEEKKEEKGARKKKKENLDAGWHPRPPPVKGPYAAP